MLTTRALIALLASASLTVANPQDTFNFESNPEDLGDNTSGVRTKTVMETVVIPTMDESAAMTPVTEGKGDFVDCDVDPSAEACLPETTVFSTTFVQEGEQTVDPSSKPTDSSSSTSAPFSNTTSFTPKTTTSTSTSTTAAPAPTNDADAKDNDQGAAGPGAKASLLSLVVGFAAAVAIL